MAACQLDSSLAEAPFNDLRPQAGEVLPGDDAVNAQSVDHPYDLLSL